MRERDNSVTEVTSRRGKAGPDGASRRPSAPDCALSRERVVRERLYNLLDALGTFPAAEKACSWDVSFARALGSACPDGYTLMHAYRPPGSALVVDHLLVGDAGVVVASPGKEGAHGRGRPAAVRDTLRQAFALRAWLKRTGWGEVPVLCAVCWPPASGLGEDSSVAMDGLWAGPVDQLAPFLTSLAPVAPCGDRGAAATGRPGPPGAPGTGADGGRREPSAGQGTGEAGRTVAARSGAGAVDVAGLVSFLSDAQAGPLL